MDFDSWSRTAANKHMRSAMLASAHTAYELKENIMSTGMHVRSGGVLQRCAQECR